MSICLLYLSRYDYPYTEVQGNDFIHISSITKKLQKTEWTVRLFLPSLYTIIIPPEGRNSKKTASCTTSSVYVNISKNSLLTRAKYSFREAPGNHYVNHVSDLFPDLRVQRYIENYTPANFLKKNMPENIKKISFLINIKSQLFNLLKNRIIISK